MALPGQLMVSNGTLFWSYSEQNKQVLVDSVAKMGKWNPLVLLYDPERLYECLSESKSANRMEFTLGGVDSLTNPKSFVLAVSSPGMIPIRVTYSDDNDSKVEVQISRFDRKNVLPDSLFEFHAPKGVDVITVP